MPIGSIAAKIFLKIFVLLFPRRYGIVCEDIAFFDKKSNYSIVEQGDLGPAGISWCTWRGSRSAKDDRLRMRAWSVTNYRGAVNVKMDDIISRCGPKGGGVNSSVIMLEMKGILKLLPGMFYGLGNAGHYGA